MEQFYNDWLNNSDKWFNSTLEFDNYLSKTYGYLIDNPNTSNPIYQILIYDQLTRHYYRNQNANHIINYFNRKALEIVIKLDLSILNYNDWMFAVLVYRHTNEKSHILFAMNEAWLRGSKSFIKATYNRANFQEELEYYYNNPSNFDKSILEYNPNENPKEKSLNYLGDFSIFPKNNNPIIVSLSGGVDSISCLYSMVQIFNSNKIIAVHINYNNRPETIDECNFLKTYCNHLNVKLYIRTINEIQRKKASDNDMREVYENYTKKVRFNSYKKAFELEGGIGIPIVILGHNKDDCFENILTNISYKNKYDNLNGIEISMIIDNINFYRPIINITKSDIYKYAINHNLPYLKNSTPDWCQRGKIRTIVVPALEKWDNRIIDGLFNITEILKDLHTNLYINVRNLKIINNSNINSLNTSLLFWKYGIFNLFNFYASNKSLNCLIERLNLFKLNFNFKEINKKTKIIIKKNLYLSIWKSKNLNEIYYQFIFDNKNN